MLHRLCQSLPQVVINKAAEKGVAVDQLGGCNDNVATAARPTGHPAQGCNLCKGDASDEHHQHCLVLLACCSCCRQDFSVKAWVARHELGSMVAGQCSGLCSATCWVISMRAGLHFHKQEQVLHDNHAKPQGPCITGTAGCTRLVRPLDARQLLNHIINMLHGL